MSFLLHNITDFNSQNRAIRNNLSFCSNTYVKYCIDLKLAIRSNLSFFENIYDEYCIELKLVEFNRNYSNYTY